MLMVCSEVVTVIHSNSKIAYLANFVNVRESLYKNIDGFGKNCDFLARYPGMEKAGKIVTNEMWGSISEDLEV